MWWLPSMRRGLVCISPPPACTGSQQARGRPDPDRRFMIWVPEVVHLRLRNPDHERLLWDCPETGFWTALSGPNPARTAASPANTPPLARSPRRRGRCATLARNSRRFRSLAIPRTLGPATFAPLPASSRVGGISCAADKRLNCGGWNWSISRSRGNLGMRFPAAAAVLPVTSGNCCGGSLGART